MGALAGLGNASVNQKDPFFLVGHYTVELKQVKVHTSPDQRVMFIINGKLIKSNVAERPVGMTCSQVITITGNLSALGNIKAFIAACIGADVNDADAMAEIDEDMVEEAIKCGELVGLVMNLVCTEILTVKKKTPFTVHTWSLATDTKK